MPDTKSEYPVKVNSSRTTSSTRAPVPKGAAAVPAPPDENRGILARARAQAASALRQLPGASVVESRLQQVEQRMLRELKLRLDLAMGSQAPDGQDEARITRTYVVPVPEPAPRLLADLLSRASNQSSGQAQALFHSHLLAQLLPDEARLISALADGRQHPVIHIVLAPLIGASQRVVVENLSLLGKAALLSWPENTPWYLSHLERLGILQSAPEARGLDNAYAALEAGADARNRIAQAQEGSRMAPRFTRRTVRLSALGKALWAASQTDIPAETKG